MSIPASPSALIIVVRLSEGSEKLEMTLACGESLVGEGLVGALRAQREL